MNYRKKLKNWEDSYGIESNGEIINEMPKIPSSRRGEDGTYKYSKTIDRRDDTTGWRKINNKWNNEQIKNGEETTNDVGLFNTNKRDTSASGQYNIEINRNKKNEGLEESSSLNLQKNRSKTSVTGQSPLSQKTNEEDFTSINIIA